jgi:hypothetical protein
MVGLVRFGSALVSAIALTGGVTTLESFEGKDAAERWTTHQGAKIAIESESIGGSPRDHFLVMRTAKSGIAATGAQSVPADWSSIESLAFRARTKGRSGPLEVEAWVLEADKKTKFWRRFRIEGTEWTEFDLPLRFFRAGSGRLPDFRAIDRIAFYSRDEGEFALDDIELRDDPAGPGADVQLDELCAIAFAGRASRSVVRRTVEVASDHPEIDLEALATHLERVVERVAEAVALVPQEARKPRLLVFASEGDYRSFPKRFAAHLASNGPEPKSDGFTIAGIATSSWSGGHPALRPVFTHEIVHSTISRWGYLENSREWVQEGIASWLQLEFHPQADFGSVVAKGLAEASRRLPIARLTDGSAIPTDRYWQAATLIEYLAQRPGRLPAMLDAFRTAGSTALEPLCESLTGADLAGLEAEWMSWCAERDWE